MTRTEFDEEITTWSELIEFCHDNGISVCDDVIDSDYVTEIIQSMIARYTWHDIYHLLSDIETENDDYFLFDGDTITNLDYDDFDNYKADAADEYEFDEEEPDELYEDEEECDDTEESEDSVSETEWFDTINR